MLLSIYSQKSDVLFFDLIQISVDNPVFFQFYYHIIFP